jgi:hypothetical protein
MTDRQLARDDIESSPNRAIDSITTEGKFGGSNPHHRELTSHWMALISARETLWNGMKRQHQAGAATSADLNRAEQAVAEGRIGLAKVRGQIALVVSEMSKLIKLMESREKQQSALHKKGFISERELLKTREALLEAKIRLAEYKMAGRVVETPIRSR